MTGTIFLYLNKNYNDTKFEIRKSMNHFYDIEILTNDYKNIKEKYDEFISKIKKEIENNNKVNSITGKNVKRAIMNNINLIDEAKDIKIFKTNCDDFIELYCNWDRKDIIGQELVNLVKENNIEKNILIEDQQYSLDVETYNKIVKEYYEIKDKIKILIEGNTESISIEKYHDTLNKIIEISNMIRSYNLSPLEEIMLTYDYVRNRVYKEENKKEDKPSKSRDISNVMFGEEIVCAGFSGIFKAILDTLGYKSGKFPLKSIIDQSGHTRNIAYITDEKYDIEGIYFFDTTWDALIKNNEESFKKQYKYFGQTLEETLPDLEDEGLTGNQINLLTRFDIYNLINNLENNNFKNIDYKTLNSIKFYSKLTNLEDGLNFEFNDYENIKNINVNVEKLIQFLNQLADLIDTEISHKKFVRCLLNVKSIEYYNDMIDSLSKNDLIQTMIYTNKTYKVSGENNLLKLLGMDYKIQVYTIDDYKKIFNEINADKKINQVKLTKTLKKYQENRNN